jgi:DNA-binding NarL/FixJ family response regulator
MKTRIFLVDDSHTFLSVIKLFLGMLQDTLIVGQADDGAEALTQIAELKPDLVLLDIAMPKMSGLAVARSLLSMPKPPRIVFLSMHNSPEYRTAASDIGVEGFVNKADFAVELFPIMKRLREEQIALGGAAH